ncbi:MAG: PQQ-binding-like beta-propeller repeat protein [Gemmatimonadaceae bacterium]|nr:PQQ-binding-like beta-propeller repeat protein [Gemmatimonadaceae bacterium]
MTRTDLLRVLRWFVATSLAVSACDAGRPSVPSSGHGKWGWVVSLRGSNVTPGLDSAAGVLYVTTGQRELAALDAHTGRLRWKRRYGDGAPFGENVALAGGVAAVGDVDVFAVDANDGTPLWQLSTPGNEGTRTIATDGSTFFVAGGEGIVRRLDARSGRELWSARLQRGDTTLAAFGPTLIDMLLFVCGNTFGTKVETGELFALRAATGQIVWRHQYSPELPGQSSKCYSRVARSGDLIVEAQDDGRVFAHDAGSGAIRWTAPRVHSPPGDPSGPGTGPFDDRRYSAAGSGMLLATSDLGIIQALSPVDGHEIWRASQRGSPLDPPAVGSTSVAVNHGGVLVEYDLTRGAIIRRDPPSGSSASDSNRYYGAPVVLHDTLFTSGSESIRARRIGSR